jgi:hypothetical protein
MHKRLKALIITADAVTPECFMCDSVRFPNIARIMEDGASAIYGAYTGKSFTGSFDSGKNWASIYTGLAPSEHNISTYSVGSERRKPQMSDFENLSPFWKLLSENGVSVGVWAAHSVKRPEPINGYVVGVDYTSKETPDDDRIRPRTIQLSIDDNWVRDCLDGDPPPRIFPMPLKQQGYDYQEMPGNPALAVKALREYTFAESFENYKAELDYFSNALKKAQRTHPVDVLWFYTPSTDLIGHFGGIRPDDNETLLKAYDLLDAFIGDMVTDLAPEKTVFISDHGLKNFGDLVRCSDENISREAFGAIDQSVFLPGGFIAMYARNGALLLSYHSLYGCFAANGIGIKYCKITDMRTLDIYPTLLEMLDIKVPDDRRGFVQDIFCKDYVNKKILLKQEKINYLKLAVIQTHSVDITDIFINELYLQNRFYKITVIGNKKYGEIFAANPRVSAFIALEDIKLPQMMERFNIVYTGHYNARTKNFIPLVLKE